MCDRGRHVAQRGLVVHKRGNRRLTKASEVVRDAYGVAAAVTVVHHEGLSVSPRSSERRYHVRSVVSRARGVGSQGRWVAGGVGRVFAQSRSVLDRGEALMPQARGRRLEGRRVSLAAPTVAPSDQCVGRRGSLRKVTCSRGMSRSEMCKCSVSGN